MTARIVAFVAAVAMVVGALAYRARVDEDKGERGAAVRLVCATELEAVCAALAGDGRFTTTVEAAGVTAGRLAGAEPGAVDVDGWLVPKPWPALVDAARARAHTPALFEPSAPVLARSPVVMVGFKERTAALRTACEGGRDALRCLGDLARKGPVDLYQGDPRRDTAGLATLAAETLEYFKREDVGSLDLNEDDAYRGWLTALADSQRPDQRTGPVAVQTLLTQGAAAFAVVAALEADVVPAVSLSHRRGELEVIYPARVVTADVVLARRAGETRTAALRDAVAELAPKALAEAGWRVPGQKPATGIPASPLPAGNGLPNLGLLEALQSIWKEVSS